jgi:putative phosphoribosyl transferase
MYFSSRAQAGQMLAKKLVHLKDQNCSIIALNDGGVVVSAQIAAALNCPIMMLMAEPILAPGEPEAVASINQAGGYTYNKSYTEGEIEEFDMEYHQTFEQSKLDKLNTMHRLLGRNSIIRRDLLRRRTIILVSDGFDSSFPLDSVVDYLKSTKIKRLVIATPLATVNVIDRMHIMADEQVCLSVIGNYIATDHYYEDNTMPSHETIIETIQNIVQNWKS